MCPPSDVVDHQHEWERFDEEPDPNSSGDTPPLPPPRSELELYPAQLRDEQSSSPSVELIIESPTPLASTQASTNPFQEEVSFQPEVSRSRSPIEDFSSSIAEALINNSEQKQADDPVSASALASAGKDLFETMQEESDVLESLDSQVSSSVTPVLLPTMSVSDSSIVSQLSGSISGDVGPPPTSSGSATSNVSTTQLRTNLHPMNSRQRLNSMNRQQNVSILRPIPQEGTFSPDSIASNTNPFYSGSINAGNYPQLTPLSQKPSGPRAPSYVQDLPLPGTSRAATGSGHANHRRPEQPPPKPQPYSGECQWSHRHTSSGNGVVRRHRQNSAFLVQRLPSLGEFDPFGDILNNDAGMAGYVLENANNSPL